MAIDELEVKQLGRHEVADFLVVIVEGDAGMQKLHGVLHDGQDRVVDGALAMVKRPETGTQRVMSDA